MVGGRSVGGRAFGGRLVEVALARAEEQAAHGGAVPGDQRVEIAAAVTDTLGGGGENAEEDAAEGEAPDAEQGGKGEDQHTHEFKSIAELVVLLGEIGDGNERHIEDDVHAEPADCDGEITEQECADDGEGVGEHIGGVHGCDLQAVDRKLCEEKLKNDGERARLVRDQKGKPRGQNGGIFERKIPKRRCHHRKKQDQRTHDAKIRARQGRIIIIVGLLKIIEERGGQDHHLWRGVAKNENASLHDLGGGSVRPLRGADLGKGVVPTRANQRFRKALKSQRQGLGAKARDPLGKLHYKSLIRYALEVADHYIGLGYSAEIAVFHRKARIAHTAAQKRRIDN